MSIINNIKICDYCNTKIAYYTLNNGKHCCESSWQKCPQKKRDQQHIMKEVMNRPESKKRIRDMRTGVKDSEETRRKKRRALIGNTRKKGKKETKETKLKKSISHMRTIKHIKKCYPIFYLEEEMRYDPTTLKNDYKVIQVHCKNHNCENSKEKNGWFTPTGRQIEARIFAVQKGNNGLYFYCSEECKKECVLYNLKGDPYRKVEVPYTSEEYQTFRTYVLERDEYRCQYCDKKAEHVHHERPQKLEPFFALDPDLAWSVCEKCHYEKAHKTRSECSTGELSKIICK